MTVGISPPTGMTIEPMHNRGQRNLPVLVSFTAITNLADGVTKVVLPLMATQVTTLPAQVAGVSVTLTLPWLLAALHAGVLIDRFDRRHLIWIADGVRAAAVLGLVALVDTDSVTIPALYAAGLVLGIAEVVALTAAGAMIPAAVPEYRRERGNAWIAGAETVCNEFVGPFVGGLLLAMGAAFALSASGAAYFSATLLLLPLVGRFRPVRSVQDKPQVSIHRQIAEGLAFLWHQRVLRLMTLVLTVLCSSWGAWLALMPVVATQSMGASPQEYGVILSALGIGGVVGAMTVGRINRLLGRRWALFSDLIGTAAMVGMPALTSNVIAVAVAAFLGGMGGVLWSVNARTIAQSLVPDGLLGRYSAAARLFSWGAMPVGAVLGGMLAEWVSPEFALGVFSALSACAIVPFLRMVPPGDA